MPNIQIRPEAKAAHMDALRIIGEHRPIFDGGPNCVGAEQCTRPAHWRVYRDMNPRLAEVLIICGAYEVYQTFDGKPIRYAVLERADGPAGTLYVASKVFNTNAEAIRYACEMACASVAEEMGEALPLPAPVPGIKYRQGDTEYEVVDDRLMKRLPFASGWTPAV